MVHQSVAIMYCTQQVILGKNFRDRIKTVKVFPLESFAVYGNGGKLNSDEQRSIYPNFSHKPPYSFNVFLMKVIT